MTVIGCSEALRLGRNAECDGARIRQWQSRSLTRATSLSTCSIKLRRKSFTINADDAAVRDQAIKFLQMFRAERTHGQTIVDILHASRISRRDSEEGIAEIGFVMGMQFGFELAQSFPPLGKLVLIRGRRLSQRDGNHEQAVSHRGHFTV